MEPSPLARSDWPAVCDAFERFFAEVGEVTVSTNEVEFLAGDTGLVLSRNGTSRSFMPLHGLESTWEQVVFDPASHEVVLSAGVTRYVYRVPPRLLR
jgi:hypothetical protein